MPQRICPIVEGEIYHVFNRSVAGQPIFFNNKDYLRAFEVLKYYSFIKPGLRFSHYNRLPINEKTKFLDELVNNHDKQIDLLSYCLMPNHFHFLIKEINKNGISTLMRNFQDSYAKYLNIKKKRHGALFQSMFKAVRIENDEQLNHVCRYIHLNPYMSFVVNSKADLEKYPWSSFPEYLEIINTGIINKNLIKNYYSSINEFKAYTYNEVEYRRMLKEFEYYYLDETNGFRNK